MTDVGYNYSCDCGLTKSKGENMPFVPIKIKVPTLEGYIRDEDGNKYVLDGMMGMGEDKTLLL